jgi:hypothetical protein
MIVEYCVFCPGCNSPIPIGSVQSPNDDSRLILSRLTVTCQSCDRSSIHEGKPAVFSKSGEYTYWGVVCNCGVFQPVLRATIDHREKVPDVEPFKMLCRHRQISPSQGLFEQFFDKTHLKKVEQAEEIQNFQPYQILR